MKNCKFLRILSALNFFLKAILICCSKGLLAFMELRHFPAFWLRDITIWLVLSVFNFIPTSVVVYKWVSVFFFTVFLFSLSVLTSQAYVGDDNFHRFHVSLDFLSFMVLYSQIRLQSNGDKACASFKAI
jgi:hypothetical protein